MSHTAENGAALAALQSSMLPQVLQSMTQQHASHTGIPPEVLLQQLQQLSVQQLPAPVQTLTQQPDMLSQHEKDVLRHSIASEADDNQFELLLQVINRTRLDPFGRQIFPVFRWNRRNNCYDMTIQTSIDGFRLIAQRTGKYQGQVGPYWCGPDGIWHDVWLSDKPPAAAKVGVLNRDFTQPLWSVARFAAYAQTYNGQLKGLWEKNV